MQGRPAPTPARRVRGVCRAQGSGCLATRIQGRSSTTRRVRGVCWRWVLVLGSGCLATWIQGTLSSICRYARCRRSSNIYTIRTSALLVTLKIALTPLSNLATPPPLPFLLMPSAAAHQPGEIPPPSRPLPTQSSLLLSIPPLLRPGAAAHQHSDLPLPSRPLPHPLTTLPHCPPPLRPGAAVDQPGDLRLRPEPHQRVLLLRQRGRHSNALYC